MDIKRDEQPSIPPKESEIGLVMSGGGALAAYQVGFLRCLARHFPDLHAPIITGISAGAINAAYLASHSGAFRDKVETLVESWAELTTDQIFRVDSRSLAGHVMRWGLRLLMGRASRAIKVESLLDNTPLRALLERLLKPVDGQLPGIQYNLDRGELKAVAITASSYSTGRSVTWVQGRDIPTWERAHRKSVRSILTIDHILASAALPMFFPAVRIDGAWYGDGGILLTAPLSPAVHLGASRILAISTRYANSNEKAEDLSNYPPPAQIVGSLFDALFLDLFDADALRLERINLLIELLPEERRHGMRPIDLLLLRPSRDLGQLANEYEAQMPRAFRFMTRGLGTQEVRSNDLLSILMFQPDYLKRLIDLGCADAEARKEEIAAFLAASPSLTPGCRGCGL